MPRSSASSAYVGFLLYLRHFPPITAYRQILIDYREIGIFRFFRYFTLSSAIIRYEPPQPGFFCFLYLFCVHLERHIPLISALSRISPPITAYDGRLDCAFRSGVGHIMPRRVSPDGQTDVSMTPGKAGDEGSGRLASGRTSRHSAYRLKL